MKINSTVFKAKITISNENNIFSSNDINKLKKTGENIGTDADTITITTQKAQDMIILSRTAEFKSLTPSVESFNLIFKKISSCSPCQILEEDLNNINKLYNKLKKLKF